MLVGVGLGRCCCFFLHRTTTLSILGVYVSTVAERLYDLMPNHSNWLARLLADKARFIVIMIRSP